MKKTVEIKEIREKDNKALIKELRELENKVSDLRFKTSFRKLKNFHEITVARKKIARIWTILNEKAIQKIEEAK